MGEGGGGRRDVHQPSSFFASIFPPFLQKCARYYYTQAVEFLTYQQSQHNTTYLLIIWDRLLPGGEQGREINLVKKTITFTKTAHEQNYSASVVKK